MEESKKMIRFSYKGAFLFFTFVILANLLFTPLLTAIGLSNQMSLFLANSITCSIGLAFVVLVIEKKYKDKLHALKFFLFLLFLCTAASYYLVFLY